MLGSLVLSALCTAFSVAASSVYSLAVHETLDAIPDGFFEVGPASGDSLIILQLALKPRDIDGLEKVFYEISTPGNVKYGQHLSKEEVAAFVKPTNLSTTMVNDWLASNHLASISVSLSGSTFQVSLPVSKANEMLGTNFHVFRENTTGKQAIRALSYSIPASLKGHLDHVHPTVK